MAALTATVNEEQGREGHKSTACQVGISFGCCCFSSYKVLTEGKLQTTCSLEQHEKAGRLLSLSREIIEAMRAAQGGGDFLSRLLGLQQLMCLSEAANPEKKLKSLPSHFTWQDSRVSLPHVTPGEVLL